MISRVQLAGVMEIKVLVPEATGMKGGVVPALLATIVNSEEEMDFK